jgi:hypothetical protein
MSDQTEPALRTPRIKLRFDPNDAHPIIRRLEEREHSEHGINGHRHIDLLAERRAA